jgi:hypothetical protein
MHNLAKTGDNQPDPRNFGLFAFDSAGKTRSIPRHPRGDSKTNINFQPNLMRGFQHDE